MWIGKEYSFAVDVYVFLNVAKKKPHFFKEKKSRNFILSSLLFDFIQYFDCLKQS